MARWPMALDRQLVTAHSQNEADLDFYINDDPVHGAFKVM